MPKRPLYVATPDYRGNWLVVGPDLSKFMPDLNSAYALAKELNAHHERVLAIAARVRERHLQLVPKVQP